MRSGLRCLTETKKDEMERQNEGREWSPDSQKHEVSWKKMWFDIIDSRRWSIRQTHGDECAKSYRFLEEEQAFFMKYGKLPHNAVGMKTSPKSTEWVQAPCEKCDQQDAKAIVKMVDDYHAWFWKLADRTCGDKRAKYEERLDKQRKDVEATAQYKADKETRKHLDDYLSRFLANFQANGKETNEGGQQGGKATARQATEQTEEREDYTIQE